MLDLLVSVVGVLAACTQTDHNITAQHQPNATEGPHIPLRAFHPTPSPPLPPIHMRARPVAAAVTPDETWKAQWIDVSRILGVAIWFVWTVFTILAVEFGWNVEDHEPNLVLPGDASNKVLSGSATGLDSKLITHDHQPHAVTVAQGPLRNILEKLTPPFSSFENLETDLRHGAPRTASKLWHSLLQQDSHSQAGTPANSGHWSSLIYNLLQSAADDKVMNWFTGLTPMMAGFFKRLMSEFFFTVIIFFGCVAVSMNAPADIRIRKAGGNGGLFWRPENGLAKPANVVSYPKTMTNKGTWLDPKFWSDKDQEKDSS